MKFRYKKYGPGVLRPVIPIEVICNGLEVPYEVFFYLEKIYSSSWALVTAV